MGWDQELKGLVGSGVVAVRDDLNVIMASGRRGNGERTRESGRAFQ